MLFLAVLCLFPWPSAAVNDNVATANLINAFFPVVFPGCLAANPCACSRMTCENGRVVALVIAGSLRGDSPDFLPALATFPDLSGYTQLRNLSFVHPYLAFDTQNYAALGLMTTLEHVSYAKTGANRIDFNQGGLPPQVAAWGATLRSFKMFGVANFKPFPAAIASWTKLREFSLVEVNLASLFGTGFNAPFASWAAIEVIFMSNVYIDPPQRLPQLDNKANLTQYSVRICAGFNLFDEPLLFESPKLSSFQIFFAPGLSGTLPSNLGSATSLREFAIGQTAMDGTFPSAVKNLKKLDLLGVAMPLTGTLTTEIGALSALRLMAFVDVKFSGMLPSEIGALTNLVSLAILGDTTDRAFSGTLPREVADLVYKNLGELVIADTAMGGKLPEATPSQTPSRLELVFLSQNNFRCRLPNWIVQSIPAMDGVDCSIVNNQFCQLAKPLGDADMAKCEYTLASTCACGECTDQLLPGCPDCLDVIDGPSRPDACGECDGDSLACADCRGVAYGTDMVDTCGVCGGSDGCYDCAGVLFGTTVYDFCDVCGGDSTSCRDCAGTPRGTLQYDDCDVCGGDNLTCQDCSGAPSGTLEYDACGLCVDFTSPAYLPTCYDCAGALYGTSVRDLCGVCDGNNVDCDPDKIGAGVVGLHVVVPWLIAFVIIDLLLAIIYGCMRMRRSRSPAAPSAGPPPSLASRFGHVQRRSAADVGGGFASSSLSSSPPRFDKLH